MPDLTWNVSIDFDYAGGTVDFATPGDDVTAYVQRVDILGGISSGLVAGVGTCDLVLDNSGARFSPANMAGPYFGRLTPGKPVRVQVQRSTAGGSVIYTVFRGTIRRIAVQSGPDSHARLHCADTLALLQDSQISLPLQENVTGNTLLTHVVNAALRSPVATATIALTDNPADGDTVTANGTLYTFKAALGASPNQVLIGTRREDTAANLAACINGAEGAGTRYTTNSARPAGVTAEALPELPDRATVWHADSTILSGGALVWIAAGVRYNGYWQQSSAANGNSFTQSVWLQRGTYTLSVLGRTGSGNGMVDWAIDGMVAISGQDWYSAATTDGVIKTATVNIASDGYHLLIGTINGKNASSSGYSLPLVKLWFKG